MGRVSNEYAEATCKPGKGAETCRYLGMGPDGWECMKGTLSAPLLDTRAYLGKMVARGNNCDGMIAGGES